MATDSNSGTMLEDREQYSIVLSEDRQSLMFDWKFVAGLSAEDFGNGIVQFAEQCNTHKPERAVIVAQALDPDSSRYGLASIN